MIREFNSIKQKEVLWERLRHLLKETLMEKPVETWQRVEDAESNDGMEVESAPEMVKNHYFIPVVGIVPALPESEHILQSAIQRVCGMWWEKGLEGKEQLGKTAFIILLRKSLSKGVDIVCLWKLHQALLCFDYDSEDSNEIKDLLLQCFMSVKHIKKEEGRRILSFFFSWNVNFIKMIHGTVKNQLEFFPRSLMEYISEIYFRAWKKVSGETLEILEHSCIQDFMHHGIHLPRSSSVYSKVREMLSYFHKQSKVRQGVEEMLYRLYKPILWRALKVSFLFRMYLLEDPHPVVRSTGILGVSQITSKYWEMIPPTVIADLLKKLIEELACDVTSADVRCSVFKCLPITLDNKLSHPLLEQLLPAVKHSIHDNSEKVRVAFVDMLLKIKATKAAKFWKICPMEHLLARLEVDSRPVSRRIVNLLFNSFLPISQPEDVWCERCVTLIQMNSAAARKFYQYAYEYTAPTNIAKLMLTIRRCLNACIQKAVKESFDDDGEDEGEKENLSVLNDVLSITDVASMASLLEITVILWRSIHKALDHNEDAKDYTIRKFASVLPEYLKVFKDDCCVTPLVILASFMPPAAIPTFSCGVISKLRNIDSGADQSKYSTLIDCMCRWGQVGHVLELACDWLSDVLTPRKNVKASERRVRIHVTHESKPELALDYIEYLLTHPVNRGCLLSVPKKKLNHLLKVLSAAKVALSLLHRALLQLLPLLLQTDAYLSVCKDVIMVGLGNVKFQLVYIVFISLARGAFCTPVLLCALKEITEASLTQSSEVDEVADVLHAAQATFQKVLECVAGRIKEQHGEGMQLIQSIQTPLGDFLHAVQCWHSFCPAVHQSVFSTLLAAILAEIKHELQEVKLIQPTLTDHRHASDQILCSAIRVQGEEEEEGSVVFYCACLSEQPLCSLSERASFQPCFPGSGLTCAYQ
uniref:Non-SMC condensin II complex subunit G2 n=1 Tax=Pavo cristatus TaxID=9049 RepID=A0A8C9EM17_PAVCR